MPKPKPGDRYEYQGEVFGGDLHAIQPGTVMQIREFVAAKTKGAHDDKEDSVVLELEEPSIVYQDGKPVVGSYQRAISFGEGFFKDNFKAVR